MWLVCCFPMASARFSVLKFILLWKWAVDKCSVWIIGICSHWVPINIITWCTIKSKLWCIYIHGFNRDFRYYFVLRITFPSRSIKHFSLNKCICKADLPWFIFNSWAITILLGRSAGLQENNISLIGRLKSDANNIHVMRHLCTLAEMLLGF